MLMNKSPYKVMGVSFNIDMLNLENSVGKGLRYLEHISRQCLEPRAAYAALQRSKDAFNDRLFSQFLKFGRQINEYTSALEVLDNLEVELVLDEFRGEL